MSDLFDILQERYQALVARKEKGEVGEEFMEDVRAFIADAQQSGATVPDVGQRSQLRAWMRFLANILCDATGVYPDITLQPLASGQLVGLQAGHAETTSSSPSIVWMLVGGAATIVIVVGLFLTLRLADHSSAPTSAPTPAPLTPMPASTSAPPTPIGRVDVGVGRSDTGDLALRAKLFCAGATEIVAQFTVPTPLPADTHWGWRLTQAGRVAAAQSDLVWETGSTSSTVQVALPDGDPLAAGQYELTFLVDDRPVANRAFVVLAEGPRVSNVQISDVPTGADRTEFEAGTRIVYVTYDYENLCPGQSISRTVYRDGRAIIQDSEEWSGVSDGSGRLEYYQPNGLPLPNGEYEIVLGVGEEEPQRVVFTIAGPAFRDITVALGVQPDGAPILTSPDNRFDWNTKVIYAIFDYTGMSDGLRWTAVWTRNAQEVAREERFWDVASDGTEGTRWVAYYIEGGRTIPGGDYSLTLYIENVAQRTADFSILYYVPRE